MGILRPVVAGLLLSILSACATTLPTLDASKPVPDTRRFAMKQPTDSAASLIILRDSSFAGSAVGYEIFVDGEKAAKIGTSEFVELFVEPGERLIEARHPSARLGAIGDSKSVDAKQGQKYYFRINSDLGQIKLLQTSALSVGAK